MIITKDNLLRFVRENKYVTPTIISENFETSTMIASAALSELSKGKLISISNLKIGSTPYYYDPRQKNCLIELGKKHLSGYDKEAMIKLHEQQIINDAALTIQLRLSMEKIKDFAIPLEMTIQGKEIRFWVWYQRDINETKKQISNALMGKSESESIPKTQKKEIQKTNPVKRIVKQTINSEPKIVKSESSSPEKGELFIDNFFRDHYLNLENKSKIEKTIRYETSLKIRKMTIYFDCIYYLKKPTEGEILKYYASTPKPKIIFLENPPKKLIKLSQELENLEVISL